MKRAMRWGKRVLVGLLAAPWVLGALLFLAFASGLVPFGPGLSDWDYDGLPNGYSVWRCNSREIDLCKTDGAHSASIVVPAYVSKIFFDDRYIFAQRVEPAECKEAVLEEAAEYYIVDSSADDVSAPLSFDDFLARASALGYEKVEWIVTTELRRLADHSD